MVSVYNFSNYPDFLKAWINEQSQRGIQGRLAKEAGVSSTMMSLVLKGDKNLSLEQASNISDFVGFSDNECDFFFLLIELKRAGSVSLKKKINRRLIELKKKTEKISERVKKDIELTEETRAIYYSSWVYTAIRNLTALPEPHDVTSVSSRLNIPVNVVTKVIDFLLEQNLCLKKEGQLLVGPAQTHIPGDSPYVTKHHYNWRIKGMQKMENKVEDHLYFTCPMSLSFQDYHKVREIILKTIEEAMKIVAPSTSETVACLNIDYFDF